MITKKRKKKECIEGEKKQKKRAAPLGRPPHPSPVYVSGECVPTIGCIAEPSHETTHVATFCVAGASGHAPHTSTRGITRTATCALHAPPFTLALRPYPSGLAPAPAPGRMRGGWNGWEIHNDESDRPMSR